jgi:hypothetical protein
MILANKAQEQKVGGATNVSKNGMHANYLMRVILCNE